MRQLPRFSVRASNGTSNTSAWECLAALAALDYLVFTGLDLFPLSDLSSQLDAANCRDSCWSMERCHSGMGSVGTSCSCRSSTHVIYLLTDWCSILHRQRPSSLAWEGMAPIQMNRRRNSRPCSVASAYRSLCIH